MQIGTSEMCARPVGKGGGATRCDGGTKTQDKQRYVSAVRESVEITGARGGGSGGQHGTMKAGTRATEDGVRVRKGRVDSRGQS